MRGKTPSKVTIKEESEVFGTRLAHYGINIMTHSTPDLIPEKLPIEKVSDKIKRIPLANGNRGKCLLGSINRIFKCLSDHLDPIPQFMHLDSYQKILETTAWEPDDDGVENSRDAAINFMSASARFTKKPFLRQVDIAKRMAREKVFPPK